MSARSPLRLLMCLATAAAVGGSACDAGSPQDDTTDGRSAGSSPPPTATAVLPPEDVRATNYDPTFFDETSHIVDNTWFPLEPGTRFVYRGSTLDDGEREHHRVVFTVTDLTKVVDSVRTRVIWDRDYSAGELVETELAMFAQDTAGNVWHFGQYPEEYEEGEFVKAPAWVAGFRGARTGIAIKKDPNTEGPSYSQGYAPPPLNWDDRARVYQVDQETCVPFDCYEGVLVTEEFEPSKPGAFQLKFYAPDVGNVRVGWRGRNEKERETLVLVDLIRLDADQMTQVREEALALDARGYEHAKKSWGQTSPAEPLEA